MTKKVIKEIIIMLLLCLAIILVLGVLLYEYVPSNKIIPEEVSYTTPADVQEELNKSENLENEQVILTYSIDATDLNNYERINSYVPGKTNPFSSYDTSSTSGSENQSGSSNGGTNNSNNSSGSGNATGSTNETDTGYFPDKGTK